MNHTVSTHPAARFIASQLSPRKGPEKAALDSAADEEEALDAASNYALANISLMAVNAVQQWAETDDLEEGEGYGDRLKALLIGIADSDIDGDLSDAEIEVFEEAANAAGDYLSMKGVSDEDIEALLNDFENDVADRVIDLLIERLPDGEAAEEEADIFAFGGDGEALDAVYKKKIAVRKGKKVWIKKRISGTVRLSAGEKLAIRKAQRKAHTASAQMRRMKSMRVRNRMGK